MFPALTLDELTQELGSRTRALSWLHGLNELPAALPERIEGVTHRAWGALRP